MGHGYDIPRIKSSENPMRSISKIVKERKRSEKLILVIMPEGKTIEIPDTISFNGVIYGKIDEFVKRLSLARGHYVAPLKKESFLKHIDNLIKEYEEQLK